MEQDDIDRKCEMMEFMYWDMLLAYQVLELRG